MEYKLFRDSVNALGTVTDIQQEIPIETEIMVPDYLPAVFKIVKTLIHRVILQREIQNGHLLLEGYFRIEVLYQSEDQNLCTIEQKVAFSRQTELKLTEGQLVRCILVSGEVQYTNCRALSQHRLDLRGAYNLTARITLQTAQPIVTAVTGDGIQQKSCTVPAVSLYTTREKQFTLQESVELQNQPEQILHSYGNIRVQELRCISGKAVAKGDAVITLVYCCTGTDKPLQQVFSLPFHQVIDATDLPEDGESQLNGTVIGCSLAADEEDSSKTVLNCVCLMTVVQIRKLEYMGVADCFSTVCETSLSRQELTTDVLLETVNTSLEMSLHDSLPEDSLEVLECLVECFAPEVFPEEKQCIVRGRVAAHLVCRNALGEIDCYDKTADYQLPDGYPYLSQELIPILSAWCEGWRFSQTESRVQVTANIRLQGMLCKKQTFPLVENITGNAPLAQEEEVALRVYYACTGEKVFDIAKRYHADPNVISALAGIDGDTLQQDCRLLIPQNS